jgi:hypothetical protein
MKASKTLTTLSVAAALAVGGIAVAQTSGQGENTADPSASQSSTLQYGQSSADSSAPATASPDTSTLGANSASTPMDSSASAEASEPVAQVDRN